MNLPEDVTMKKAKKKSVKKEDGSSRINIKTYVYLRDRWAWEEPVSKAVQSSEICLTQAKSIEFREVSLDSTRSGKLSDWLSRYGFTVPPSISIQEGNMAPVQISAFSAVVSSPETVKRCAEVVDLSSAAERLAMKRDRARDNTTYEFSTVTCTDIELYINAGGPIWGLSFVPEDAVVSGKAVSGRRCRNKQVNYSRYLAVGLSRFGWPSPQDSVDVKTTDSRPNAEVSSSSHAQRQPACPVPVEATTDGRYGVGSDFQRNIGDADTSHNILQIWCIGGEVQVNSRSAEQPWAVPTLESATSTMVAGSCADSEESSEEDTRNAKPAQNQIKKKPSGRFKTPEELAAAKAAGKASQLNGKRQRVYDADGNVIEMRGKWKRLPGKGKNAVELDADGNEIAKPKRKTAPRKSRKRKEESEESEESSEEDDESTDNCCSGGDSGDEQTEDNVQELQRKETNKRGRSAVPESQDVKGDEAPPAKRRGRPPKVKPVATTAAAGSDAVEHVLSSPDPAAGSIGIMDEAVDQSKDTDGTPGKNHTVKPLSGKPRGRPRKKPQSEENDDLDKVDSIVGEAKEPARVIADDVDEDGADGGPAIDRGTGRLSVSVRDTESGGQLVYSDSESSVDKEASIKEVEATARAARRSTRSVAAVPQEGIQGQPLLTGAEADAAIERAILSDDGTKAPTPSKRGRKPKPMPSIGQTVSSSAKVTSSAKARGNAKGQSSGATSLPGAQKGPTARLAYCVALNNRGPTWGLCWSPASLSCSGSSTLLGALAVVCGDGSCLVLILPRPMAPTTTLNPLDVPLFDEAAVCRCEIRFERSMVSCASWDPHRPLQLVCGMMDGSVTIWNLAPYLRQDEGVVPAGKMINAYYTCSCLFATLFRLQRALPLRHPLLPPVLPRRYRHCSSFTQWCCLDRSCSLWTHRWTTASRPSPRCGRCRCVPRIATSFWLAGARTTTSR